VDDGRRGAGPETAGGRVLILEFVEGVGLTEGAEGAFEVVEEGAGHEGVGAVGGFAGLFCSGQFARRRVGCGDGKGVGLSYPKRDIVVDG